MNEYPSSRVLAHLLLWSLTIIDLIIMIFIIIMSMSLTIEIVLCVINCLLKKLDKIKQSRISQSFPYVINNNKE